MVFMLFGFLALIVVPGLDHRFGWSQAPAIVALAGDALVAVGFYVIYLVFKSNSFASSTIGVAKGQTLVSTGPYAIVRHPMYAGALIYLLGTPFALGSFWGIVVLALMTPILIWRLVDEERVPPSSGYRVIPRLQAEGPILPALPDSPGVYSITTTPSSSIAWTSRRMLS